MFARPLIDSTVFANNGGDLCGEIPVAALSRLNDMLLDSDGILRYTLKGYSEGERYFLKLVLEGECHFLCQRCLTGFSYPLKVASCLQLVSAERLEDAESDEAADFDSIEASTQLDVLDLIEDEILLGMPFAPKHPEGVCSPAKEGLQKSANPFAVLASLRKET
ncbi:MAG: YceD family protein [Gallionellaceae bacterium]